MMWNFSNIEPQSRLEKHEMSLEGHVAKWARRIASDRGLPISRVIRGLLQEAVRHWRKGDAVAGYPWQEFDKREHTKVVSVLLDDAVLAGLRDISKATGKNLSRIVSEILLDAMISETASMKLDIVKRKAG